MTLPKTSAKSRHSESPNPPAIMRQRQPEFLLLMSSASISYGKRIGRKVQRSVAAVCFPYTEYFF